MRKQLRVTGCWGMVVDKVCPYPGMDGCKGPASFSMDHIFRKILFIYVENLTESETEQEQGEREGD